MASPSVGSPSFRISKLSDPSLVSSICHPFAEAEINNEMFCFSLLTKTLVPRLVQHIKEIDVSSFECVPKLTKLTIDNFGDEGFDLVRSSVLPEILNCVRCNGIKYTPMYMGLYKETLLSVSSQYRDAFCIQQVKTFSISNDAKERELAAIIIPIVINHDAILPHFRALSLDRVDSVRCAIIDVLPKCSFDDSIMLYVLMNAAKDQSEIVRQHVALVFSEIAPTYIKEYKELVDDNHAGRFAISGFAAIAQKNGVSCIFELFESACTRFPDECAMALMDMVKHMNRNDEEVCHKMCQMLVKNIKFVWHMHEYVEYFHDKEPFFEMLSPARARNWRLRFALQKQTILFIPIFGVRLIPYALRYSGDLVAIIRDGSVSVWASLIPLGQPAIEKLEWLSTKGFKQRLIVAKTICEIGIDPQFMNLAVILSKDPVSNVRFCLASRVIGTRLFADLFSENTDPDIQILRESV